MSDLYKKHEVMLEEAWNAIKAREFWSPFPEMPSRSIYGEMAVKNGEVDFSSRLGKHFEIDQPSGGEWIGNENGLYGKDLNIKYPSPNVDLMIRASGEAATKWAGTTARERVGICAEALSRLNARSFEMANAVMHTTGQSFAMAFQAGGPHAQDRGLEAVVYAAEALSQLVADVMWVKPQGKRAPLKIKKTFHIRPRGIGLVIGCNTFPTWNSYSGLFANLVTGNTVIIKPHPKAILPLAITVEILRDILKEQGFDPNVVMLAADEAELPITEKLATHEAIQIIDFTGSSAYGSRLEKEQLRGAKVYTEKSGVNNILVDSTDNLKGMMGNLAQSLCLYSGQMCTTPQNIFIPEHGIETDEGHMSFEDVVEAMKKSINVLLSDEGRASAILGKIVNQDVMKRIDLAGQHSDCILKSREIPSQGNLAEGCRTPVIRVVNSDQLNEYGSEQFGPIIFIIKTKNSKESVEIISSLTLEKGAMTFGAYTINEGVLGDVKNMAITSGVNLSLNLTQSLMVNQAAAFSDYHGTGSNPASNVSFTNAAFVVDRFSIIGIRHHAD